MVVVFFSRQLFLKAQRWIIYKLLVKFQIIFFFLLFRRNFIFFNLINFKAKRLLGVFIHLIYDLTGFCSWRCRRLRLTIVINIYEIIWVSYDLYLYFWFFVWLLCVNFVEVWYCFNWGRTIFFNFKDYLLVFSVINRNIISHQKVFK